MPRGFGGKGGGGPGMWLFFLYNQTWNGLWGRQREAIVAEDGQTQMEISMKLRYSVKLPHKSFSFE